MGMSNLEIGQCAYFVTCRGGEEGRLIYRIWYYLGVWQFKARSETGDWKGPFVATKQQIMNWNESWLVEVK